MADSYKRPVYQITFLNDFWIFLLFLISNFLLSYTPLSIQLKITVGLTGILIPIILLGRSIKTNTTESSLTNNEFIMRIPLGVWLLLGGLAVFFRFYQLTTYSVWPHYDEGWIGYYAIQQWNHWNWDFLYSRNQIPPVYVWLLALFFKIFGSSPQTLWFVSSLLSLLALPVAYFAASTLFSRSFAFIFSTLLGLSYWPWYIARFSESTAKDLISECLIFLCLGVFLKTVPGKNSNFSYFLMGLCVGFSYYLLFIHWFFISLFISLIVVICIFKKKERPIEKILTYSAPIFLLMSPILWLEWSQKCFQIYYQHIELNQITWFSTKQIFSDFSYLSSLFWGADPSIRTYGPIWGGFFNPIISAFFLLGFLELIQRWHQPIYLALIGAFIIFISPGFITRDLETFRIAMILPVVLVIASIGLLRLYYFFPKRKLLILVFFFSISLLLDANHFRLYHDQWKSIDTWRGYAKSIERFRAYQILKTTELKEGPGIVFSDFSPGLEDQTLSAVDGNFNVAENPHLTLVDAHWAAVLVNVNFRPFLDHRFGISNAYALSSDLNASDGGWMLWIVPLTTNNKITFQHWLNASSALKPFIDLNMGYIFNSSLQESLDLLLKAYPYFKNDPFLESCFWEKMADVYLKAQLTPTSVSQNRDKTIQCLQNAITLGYPSAHLYYHLGVLYKMENEEIKAKKAFMSATHCPVNLTNTKQFL